MRAMLQKPFLVLLCLLCRFVIGADESREELYILPMGQGNAQLVIYNADDSDKRVGMLYDLGSKSLQTHPKFARRGKWEDHFIPEAVSLAQDQHKKASASQSTPKKDDDSLRADEDTPEGQKPRPSITGKITTERTLAPYQRDALKDDLKEFVLELLGGLKHLVLFASHTDLDHINFIDQDFIPNTVPITAFLCGDWFGDSCSKTDRDTSRVVKEVVGFLGTRQKTHIEFPYYWNFKIQDPDNSSASDHSTSSDGTDDRLLKFNDYVRGKLSKVEDVDSGRESESSSSSEEEEEYSSQSGTESSIDEDDDPLSKTIQELRKTCSRKQLTPPAPKALSGTLRDILKQTDMDDAVKQSTALDVVWSNTYVWSLNWAVSDVNDCSPIISCTLPSLNMSVVLTGDAGHSVFQSILMLNKAKSFMSIVNSSTTPDHLVLMMLPHHGSRHNISGHMLGFFQPNVFGIAAGNGAQHGHPSIETITWIQEATKGAQLYKDFWKKLPKNKDFRFIVIDEALTQNKYPHRVFKAEENTPVFLCPNMYGCIKWDRDGIHSNFSNAFKYKGKDYGVDYVASAFEVEKKTVKGNMKQGTMIEGIPAKGQKIKLQYIEELGDDHAPYKHLCCRKTDSASLFIGVEQEDKVVFYRLIGDAKASKKK